MAIAVGMSAGPGQTEITSVENSCAIQLVQKNYKQPITAERLARRIRIECREAFKSDGEPGTIMTMRQAIHDTQTSTFELQIRNEIVDYRTRDEVTLRR